MDQKASFGEKLRQMRENACLSQQELADKAGISQKAVSQYEQAKREPHWGSVVALAKALGVDCTAFQDGQPPAEDKKGKGKKKA
jgi:transcriptional regulator with XRE-family HTH domain